MQPVSPVVPSMPELRETVYAADQPEYQPLPVYRDSEGVVVSRWKLSISERLRALIFGDVYLLQMTFNQPLQPVLLQTEAPAIEEP